MKVTISLEMIVSHEIPMRLFDVNFRKAKSYLNTNTIAYITLSPAELHWREVVIRGKSPYTDTQLIIDAFKDHSSMTNRAPKKKSQKQAYQCPTML